MKCEQYFIIGALVIVAIVLALIYFGASLSNQMSTATDAMSGKSQMSDAKASASECRAAASPKCAAPNEGTASNPAAIKSSEAEGSGLIPPDGGSQPSTLRRSEKLR